MKHRRRRREGVLETAGLIVEGDTEFIALPLLHAKKLVANCPPLRPINLGGVGSHMAPIAIAKMLRPKVLQHYLAGRRLIVVCLDREQREFTAIEFANHVMRELLMLVDASVGATVRMVIADRAFEAWILADARGLHARGIFGRMPHFGRFEGALGKEQKKGVVEISELLGRTYSKTKDGPRLFEQLNFSEARDGRPNGHGSQSLNLFLQCLGI